jgi:biopolymer transport protein TolQ
MITLLAAQQSTPELTSSMGTFDVIANASPIVQLVLLLLIAFSVVSWAIIIFKWGAVRICYRNTESFLDTFWSGKSLDSIYSESKKFSGSAVAKIFQAGYVELQRLMEKERQRTLAVAGSEGKRISPPESSMENLERALDKANRSETIKLERSLGFLATAGSTAPFIGLFGTVWGIMNSFQNIARQGGASLTTVAPGIAEALIATAVGLACAIPAVIAFNYYSQKVRALRAQMENFSGDFLNIIKRNFLSP